MPENFIPSRNLSLNSTPDQNAFKPENFQKMGEQKFEVADPTEQTKAKDTLKSTVEKVVDSVYEAAGKLFKKHEVEVIDAEGNPIPTAPKVDAVDVLKSKDFIDMNTGGSNVKVEEAATFVTTVYGKDSTGKNLVQKFNEFATTLPLTELNLITKKFLTINNSLTEAQKREFLRDTLTVVAAQSKPEDLHSLLKDLDSGLLSFVESAPMPVSTKLGTGSAIGGDTLTPRGELFIKTFSVIVAERSNPNKLKAVIKNNLNAGPITASTLITNFASPVIFPGTTTVGATEWIDDGKVFTKGLETVIRNITSETAVNEKMIEQVNTVNSGTALGVNGEILSKLVSTFDALKNVSDRVTADKSHSVKEANDLLADSTTKAALEAVSPEVFSTIEANLSVKDPRRLQAIGERALSELFATTGGINLGDPLPWDGTKTWGEIKTEIENALNGATIDMPKAISNIEKVALFASGPMKDVAKGYFMEMVAQQLISLGGDQLIAKLDGVAAADYGTVLYDYLTVDIATGGLAGDRNNSLVQASEYWLAVLNNYNEFERVLASTDPADLPKKEALMHFVTVPTNNLVNYGPEGSIESLNGLQKAEIAKVLGVDENDPIVAKILESGDRSKALNQEAEKMEGLSKSLKGKLFSVVSAVALTGLTIATGGGALALVAGLGLGAFGVAKGIQNSGGFNKAGIGNFFKSMGASIKNAFSTLGRAFTDKNMSLSERAIVIGSTVVGTLVRTMYPGGGSLFMGAVELGAGLAFEKSLKGRQAELKTAIDTVLTEIKNNPDVSITTASGPQTVKMMPYVKVYVRKLDEIKKAMGDKYDEAKAIDDMKNMGGEYEKAALVYEKVKAVKETNKLMEKFDAVSRVTANYNAMLAGSIASNVLAGGLRVAHGVTDKMFTLRDDVIQPKVNQVTENVKENLNNFGDRVERTWDAAKNAWSQPEPKTIDQVGLGARVDNVPNQLDSNWPYDVPERGSGLADGSVLPQHEWDVTGNLNLPGSAWNGTKLGMLEGIDPTNPSHYFGGIDGMAATKFQMATAPYGSDYLEELFGGRVDIAHQVLNDLKANKDLTFAQAYQNQMQQPLP